MQINEEYVMIWKKGWKKNKERDRFYVALFTSLIYKSSAETILNIDAKGWW